MLATLRRCFGSCFAKAQCSRPAHNDRRLPGIETSEEDGIFVGNLCLLTEMIHEQKILTKDHVYGYLVFVKLCKEDDQILRGSEARETRGQRNIVFYILQTCSTSCSDGGESDSQPMSAALKWRMIVRVSSGSCCPCCGWRGQQ